jgi:acetyl esterase/lipase
MRRLCQSALWLASTAVQISIWLYELLMAAGLYLWVRTCGGIVLFSMVLLPGFLRMAKRIATEPDTVMVHDVPYGSERRQYVDLYLPQRGPGAARLAEAKAGAPTAKGATYAPVVLFLAGGGWTIGYKYWGAGVGFRLAARGALVVAADYRQFPQTNCNGMVEDVGLALRWAKENVSKYGGDPDRVLLLGQSAGAHLASLYTLRALRHLIPSGREEEAFPNPGSALPAGVVALSGVFDVGSALDPFRRRGMTDRMVEGIFGGVDSPHLEACSPLAIAQQIARDKGWARSDLPPLPESRADTPTDDAEDGASVGAPPPLVASAKERDPRGEMLWVLLHGAKDAVALPDQAARMFRELHGSGWKCIWGEYPNAGHTSPMIEDAMTGIDYLLEDLSDICCHLSGPHALALPHGVRGAVEVGTPLVALPNKGVFASEPEPMDPLNPDLLVHIGKAVNPF